MEYRQGEFSPTDQYFDKMGLQVRYFMPPGSVAPLAFYFQGDLLGDYSNLELIATISSRLIVNKASMKMQHARIQALIDTLRDAVEARHPR